jgi:hypothetical protein
MSKKMKYPNLKALAAAFTSGELNRKHYKLILDNDDAFLSYVGPVPRSADADDYRDSKSDEARTWYRGNGYSDLADAVEAAGIPCEWC